METSGHTRDRPTYPGYTQKLRLRHISGRIRIQCLLVSVGMGMGLGADSAVDLSAHSCGTAIPVASV